MNLAQLAGIIIIINFSFGIVNSLGIYTTETQNLLEDKISSNLLVQVLSGTATFTIGDAIWNGDKYLGAAVDLIATLFQMTQTIPNMLSSSPFKWPPLIVTMITILQTLIFVLGFAEFLRGHNIQ